MAHRRPKAKKSCLDDGQAVIGLLSTEYLSTDQALRMEHHNDVPMEEEASEVQ
jgi:hypothetical protein